MESALPVLMKMGLNDYFPDVFSRMSTMSKNTLSICRKKWMASSTKTKMFLLETAMLENSNQQAILLRRRRYLQDIALKVQMQCQHSNRTEWKEYELGGVTEYSLCHDCGRKHEQYYERKM